MQTVNAPKLPPTDAKDQQLMDTHPYTVVIERDIDSGWLVGEVVELPGCHTQAPDMASLEANIREAIEVYLEVVEDVERESIFVGTMRVDIPA